jgi:hypothetical protein
MMFASTMAAVSLFTIEFESVSDLLYLPLIWGHLLYVLCPLQNCEISHSSGTPPFVPEPPANQRRVLSKLASTWATTG